jgi:hypothetical protein
MQDSYDVATWHLLFLLLQWFLDLPPCDEAMGHKETHIQFKFFLASEWENLHEEFFFANPSFGDKFEFNVFSPT